MIRYLSLSLMVIAALIVAVGNTAPASAQEPGQMGRFAAPVLNDGASNDTGQVREPRTAASCADLAVEGRTLDQEIADLGPSGAAGRPALCLFYYPTEDVYKGIILHADGIAGFRAAKLEAVRRLSEGGLDVCAIGTWSAYGKFGSGDNFSSDDLFSLPVECQPRFVPGDAGAEPWMDAVRTAFSQTIDRTAEQMSWRPNRSVTVRVETGVDVAIATRLKYTSSAPERATQDARNGRSFNLTTPYIPYGTLIVINLVLGDTSVIPTKVAHEYTHFAQGGIGGAALFFPMWFTEGQGAYQEERNGIARDDYLGFARRAQLDGKSLALSDIARPEDWRARELDPGGEYTYSRGYAAVAFLTERYGFDATVQLLRANHDGSIDGFNGLLADLTGMDLDEFDAALGDWLVSLPWYESRDQAGKLHLEYTISPDASRAQGTLTVDSEITCGDGRRSLRPGLNVAFLVTRQPNGRYVGQSGFFTIITSLDGAITPTEYRGTWRYTNTQSGCDTGAINFAAGTTVVTAAKTVAPPTAGSTAPGSTVSVTTSQPATTTPPATATPPSTTPAPPATTPLAPIIAQPGQWLATDANGYVRVEFTVNPDGTTAQGVVRFVKATPCTNSYSVPAGRAYAFNFTLQPSGTLSGSVKDGSITIGVGGRFLGTTAMMGSVEYRNTNGCTRTVITVNGGVQGAVTQ